MKITEQSIIGELVAGDYRTATIFKNHGIDFCCHGNRSIAIACQELNIPSQTLIEKLQQTLEEKGTSQTDYISWPLDLLVDYIEKKHHRYVEAKIREIQPFLNRIVQVHGDGHPELSAITHLFNAAANELTSHMKKEEMVLFPYIRKMVKAQETKETIMSPPFGTIQNPVAMMHQEHDTEGERFREITRLSQNYLPPVDACNTYRVTFSLLKEFEEDLHLHIHLENNILFPRAIELEKELICMP